MAQIGASERGILELGLIGLLSGHGLKLIVVV